MTTTNQLSEKDIVSYLIENPEIYQNYPQLLEHLPLSHEVEGTVSLIERQLKQLREKNSKLQKQLSELIENANHSEKLFHLTTQLFSRWFNLNDKAKIILQAANDLMEVFEIDGARIIFDNPENKIIINEIYNNFSIKFPDQNPQCFPCELSLSQKLFQQLIRPCRSIALLPIGEQAEKGMIVLGSCDSNGFKATSDTMFLKQIAIIFTSLL